MILGERILLSFCIRQFIFKGRRLAIQFNSHLIVRGDDDDSVSRLHSDYIEEARAYDVCKSSTIVVGFELHVNFNSLFFFGSILSFQTFFLFFSLFAFCSLFYCILAFYDVPLFVSSSLN